MIIDCDGCGVRGHACGDCVIAVLLGAPPDLQADEQRAISVLADAGLVPPLRLVDPVEEHRAIPGAPAASGDVTDDTPCSSTKAV